MTTTLSSPLTGRQREVLRALCDHMREYGRPPTVREMMEALGLTSPNALRCHVKALKKRGYLEPAGPDVTARSLRLAGARLVLEYTDDEAGRRLREAVEGGDNGRA